MNLKRFSYGFTLLALLIGLTSCGSDDDSTSACTPVLAGLEAVFTGSQTICSGQAATLTITGTPAAEVTYSDGTNANSLIIDASGSSTITVMPTSTTEYSLTTIALDACDKSLTGSVTVTIGGAPIKDNLVGTWQVTDENDGSDGGTATFLVNGTGMGSTDGAFTRYSSLLLETAENYNWSYDSFEDRIFIDYVFSSGATGSTYRFEVDENECDEVVLRNVTIVSTPQETFRLVRI